jgi:hypothetical protein
MRETGWQQRSKSPEQEARLKRLWKRLDFLTDAHDKTIKIIEHLSPFYPQDIYLKLGECEQAGTKERSLMAGTRRDGDDWNSSFPAYNAVLRPYAIGFDCSARLKHQFISLENGSLLALRARQALASIRKFWLARP